MNGYGVIRAIGQKLARFGSNESGAAALVLAAAIMTIGFTALAIFLKGSQSEHALERAKAAGTAQTKITNAVLVYYLSNSSHVLPCPDTLTTPVGTPTSTCTANGNYVGVLPWQTLGLS